MSFFPSCWPAFRSSLWQRYVGCFALEDRSLLRSRRIQRAAVPVRVSTILLVSLERIIFRLAEGRRGSRWAIFGYPLDSPIHGPSVPAGRAPRDRSDEPLESRRGNWLGNARASAAATARRAKSRVATRLSATGGTRRGPARDRRGRRAGEHQPIDQKGDGLIKRLHNGLRQ
jgi:hypothetical protein